MISIIVVFSTFFVLSALVNSYDKKNEVVQEQEREVKYEESVEED